MTTTGLRSLDHAVQSAKDWLGRIEEDLHLENEQQAYQCLRAVMHALRDRLTVDEAADLAAQLPMVVRGIYYEAYVPAGKPLKVRDDQEFLDIVAEKLPQNLQNDVVRVTESVFRVTSDNITEGEAADVRGMLPGQIARFWPQG